MKTQSILTSVVLVALLAVSSVAQSPKDEGAPNLEGKALPTVRPRTVAFVVDSKEALKNARLIFVKSTSLLVGTSVIETKLQKRREFQQLGLAITRNVNEADLILEVEHDLFTKYTYTVVDTRSNVLVASGKLSSLGGTVAGKVAERFMKQMLRAR